MSDSSSFSRNFWKKVTTPGLFLTTDPLYDNSTVTCIVISPIVEKF